MYLVDIVTDANSKNIYTKLYIIIYSKFIHGRNTITKKNRAELIFLYKKVKK